MAESRAFALRALIEERNINHRDEYGPQDADLSFLLINLQEEVSELWSATENKRATRDDIAREIADVFVMTCAITLRYGLSFADLDALAVQKLHLRFPGSADAEAAADAMTKDRIPLVLCIRSDSETGEAL